MIYGVPLLHTGTCKAWWYYQPERTTPAAEPLPEETNPTWDSVVTGRAAGVATPTREGNVKFCIFD